LAQTVFDGYKTKPIYIAKLCSPPSAPNTYVVALAGTQFERPDGATGGPQVLLQYLVNSLGIEDAYSNIVLQSLVRAKVPDGANLILAGHSLGGMVAQNLPTLSKYTQHHWKTVRVVTFGSPFTNQPSLPNGVMRRFATKYDPIVVGTSGLFQPFYTWIDSGGLLDFHGAYPNSVDLLHYDGFADLDGSGQLRIDSKQESRWPANLSQLPTSGCTQLRYRNPPTIRDNWAGKDGEKMRWHTEFAAAQSQTEQNLIAEQIGMRGMELEAASRGYKLIWPQPGEQRAPGYGVDAIYLDPQTGAYVIGEAKGGYNFPTNADPVTFLEQNVLQNAYGCLQGTIGWAQTSLEAVTRSLTKQDPEVRAAGQVLNALRANYPVRVEVFWTEQQQGWPGVTRHFVTDSQP